MRFKTGMMLFLLLALCAPAWAQVTFDGATDGGYDETPGTTQTFSHTVTSNTNGYLVVCASSRNNQTVTGVTYNGDPMDLIIQETETAFGVLTASLWGLKIPDTGAHDVVVTFSGTPSLASTAGAISFTGVDQTTPFSNATSAEGNSTSPATVAVSSAVGKLVVDCVTQTLPTGAQVAGAGQTERWQNAMSGNNFSISGASTEAGAASVTMSWALTPTDMSLWLILGVSLNEASGAPATRQPCCLLGVF